MEEGCGGGFTCTHSDKYGYGCAPTDGTSDMVCCSAGQEWDEPSPCVQESKLLDTTVCASFTLPNLFKTILLYSVLILDHAKWSQGNSRSVLMEM